jgi:lipoprotein-anchoring transpeptidase ErfK/SrfK
VTRLLARGGTLLAASRERVMYLHAAPGTDRAFMRIDADNPWGQPVRLLVVRDARDEEGDVWLRVPLPIWPNGQAGWVAASDVRVAEASDRVVVDLSARSLVRTREGRRVASLPVAVGSSATPTPPGRYFVWAKVATGRPSGPYGSYILGLSGFSEAIQPWTEWPGEPRLAIHGTDDPGDAGRAVSNGCIRVLNGLLRALRDVPMGTPVIIRP